MHPDRASMSEAVLRRVGLAELWDGDRPAEALPFTRPERLSDIQRVAIRAALAIWRGQLEPSAVELLGL